MGFETLFVTNRASVTVSAVGEGHGKDKPTGSEGAFMSLMSMALAALFGGGPENSAASQTEGGLDGTVVSSLAVETQAPAGGNAASAETRLSPEMAWVLTEGGSPPVSGQTAGLVEAAHAAETGGQTQGAAEFSHVDSGASVPTSHTRTSALEALVEQAGDLTGEGILTSATAISEAAVAPAYRGLTATGSAHTSAALTRMALEGKLGVQAEPVASGDEVPLVDEVEAAEPSTTQASQPADLPGTPAQAVRPTGSPVSEGSFLTVDHSGEKAEEGLEIAGEANVRADEAETSFEDVEPAVAEKPDTVVLPAADVTGRSVEAAAEPDTTVGAVDIETSRAADAIRSARKMAETLLRESLKRLPRSVEMRLDPPQLGSVTALLSQRGQEVTVKFIAHTNEAQRALETATEDLARALSEKGLTLTGFSVDPGYSGEKGREHRQGPEKPSASRYHRMVRPLGIAGVQAFRQPDGAFSWLA